MVNKLIEQTIVCECDFFISAPYLWPCAKLSLLNKIISSNSMMFSELA